MASPPRILLVEDDPVSQAFLQDALSVFPARVDVAGSAAVARRLSRDAPGHVAWLIDATLPDGDGPTLLASLRKDDAAAIALAHTASPSPADHARLRAAGFARVLAKPISVAGLHAALREALAPAGSAPGATADVAEAARPQDWDDAAALRALNGAGAQLAPLRRLFLEELAGQRARIHAALAGEDAAAAEHDLHRLQASCGFVGAGRLAQAVAALRRAPGSVAALQAFQDAADALLAVA